jgi:hypothetical protein
MAINKNHEFEDLEAVKCAIVEKNVSQERVDFLKNLLESNNYKVVVVPTPVKVAPPSPTPADATAIVNETAPPSTFTVGVTDLSFNAVNAIFGRILKTKNGHVVTQAYWLQKENVSHDEVPYYERS